MPDRREFHAAVRGGQRRLSVLFAVAAADGGLLASFQSNMKASVYITTISFALYVAARLTGPLVRGRHQDHPAERAAASATIQS